MSILSILYILINYIFLMSITIYTIVKKVDFVEYMKTIVIVCCCLNLSVFAFDTIIKILRSKSEDENVSTFELDIKDSEEDIKKLLNEVSEEEKNEILNSVKDKELLIDEVQEYTEDIQNIEDNAGM